jgi:hypothetical protein
MSCSNPPKLHVHYIFLLVIINPSLTSIADLQQQTSSNWRSLYIHTFNQLAFAIIALLILSFKTPIPYPQCNQPLSIGAKIQSLPQVIENGKRKAVPLPRITLAHLSSNRNPEAHSSSLQDAKIAS